MRLGIGKDVLLMALFQLDVFGDLSFTTPQQSTTYDNYDYTLLSTYGYSVGSNTWVVLNVRTCSDAYIGLMKNNHVRNHGSIYEVVIGGWDNTKTFIRDQRQGQCHAEKTKVVLDCNAYRGFKVSWTGGTITVFTDDNGSWKQLIAWTDSSPFTVKFIGVTTSIWATGNWIIPVQDTTTTSSTTTTTTPTTTTTTPTTTTTTPTTTTTTPTTTTTTPTTTTTTPITTTTTPTTTTTTPTTTTTTPTTTTTTPTTTTTTTPTTTTTTTPTTTTTTPTTTTTTPKTTTSTHTTTTTTPTSTTTPNPITTTLTANIPNTTNVPPKHTTAPNSETKCVCSCYSSCHHKDVECYQTEIRSKLVVEKKTLSSYRRSLISAPDDRLSSKVIGLTGILTMVCTFGPPLFSDFFKFIVYIKSALKPVT